MNIIYKKYVLFQEKEYVKKLYQFKHLKLSLTLDFVEK